MTKNWVIGGEQSEKLFYVLFGLYLTLCGFPVQNKHKINKNPKKKFKKYFFCTEMGKVRSNKDFVFQFFVILTCFFGLKLMCRQVFESSKFRIFNWKK